MDTFFGFHEAFLMRGLQEQNYSFHRFVLLAFRNISQGHCSSVCRTWSPVTTCEKSGLQVEHTFFHWGHLLPTQLLITILEWRRYGFEFQMVQAGPSIRGLWL